MNKHRLRKDPRALRQPQPGRNNRKRISPRGTVTAATDEFVANIVTKVETTVIDQPLSYILVIPNLVDGRLDSHDLDLLGAARQLADAGKCVAVLAVLFTTCKDDLGAAGVDRVIQYNSVDFLVYSPELRAAALIQIVDDYAPEHLLFPDNSLGGGDLGRRVAVKLGEHAATHVWRIDPIISTESSGLSDLAESLQSSSCISRIQNGHQDLTRATPRVLLLEAETSEPAADVQHEARELESIAIDNSVSRITDHGSVEVDPNQVPLAEAGFIVSAGNGVSDWNCFHRLSKALHCAEGGSRVAVDNGFLDRDKQVGATGTLVSANVYLAFGISGAPQHLQGIVDCNHVITVNLDKGCDMVKRANLSVIGDAQEIMSELLQMVESK